MRKFLCLLLGSATVVGFEVAFGLSRWRGFDPGPRFRWSPPFVPGNYPPGTRVMQHFSSRNGVRVLDCEIVLGS